LSLLAVNDLHKAYGNLRAVQGITFAIDAGEVFGLLGPNGAGKTTAINVIARVLPPDRGTITLNGTSQSTTADYKRRIGFIPQEISLSERLSARENLVFFGRLYGMRKRVLAERAAAVMDTVGLSDRADDTVSAFSGGMKRRLNIAVALLHEPDLLLMDEPTAGVDPQARAYIFEVVEHLAAEGRAVLYTTHYIEEAQRLCHRTAIIDHGKILAMGTLAELTQLAGTQRDLVLEADNLTPDLVAALAKRLDEVPHVINGRMARLSVAQADFSLSQAVLAADELGIHTTAIGLAEPNLETVFLELTGRALRD
jgi:ABC-2 type transport system ATP-binding protein